MIILGCFNFFKDQLNGKFINCDEYVNGAKRLGKQVPKQIKIFDFEFEITYSVFRNKLEAIFS